MCLVLTLYVYATVSVNQLLYMFMHPMIVDKIREIHLPALVDFYLSIKVLKLNDHSIFVEINHHCLLDYNWSFVN